MQRKFMVFFSIFILLSLLIAPVSAAQAQGEPQDASPECPPYKPGILQDKSFLASLSSACITIYKEAARQENILPAAGPDIVSQTVGGPDSFGYTYNNAVAYSWISAATNSGLTGDDQFKGPINIGFPFPFYGTSQTQLYLNTNGLITFGAGSTEWGAYPVPNELKPNNFIAPFWDDLLVGASYNSGGIYYSHGGTAPNRYFVIEWRGVENYAGTGTFSFEAILYENGDIVVQHRSRPTSYYSTVGIEDNSGYQGLQYQYGSSGITVSRAIRFYYPSVATARILAYPVQRGGFVPLTGPKDFPIVVTNTGALGTDTYDITNFTSSWPVAYYAADGATALSDTDGDLAIDTGPIAAGASKTIIARYHVLEGTVVGDSNLEQLQLRSSLNTSKVATVSLSMSVPAGFANVLVNETDGAMSLLTASSSGMKISKATGDNYLGYDIAVAQLTNGNYFYVWSQNAAVGATWVRNIEYAILNRQGALVRAPAKLTNNTGTVQYTTDSFPAVAVTPNGTVGVVWRRYIFDDSKDKYNYNIFFATLNAAGTPLTGPSNVTGYTSWYDSEDEDVPQLYSPSIAGNSENRFVLVWEDDRQVDSDWEYNVWFALRNSTGSNAKSPEALTNNDQSWGPVVNSLTAGKVIVTWLGEEDGPFYAILNTSGSWSKHGTNLDSGTNYWSPDAVYLPNGKTAVAWATATGVQYDILDSTYDIQSGPHTATSPSSTPGRSLSVTTDAFSRVIMTWVDGGGSNKQLYALGNSNGTYLTNPLFYNTSKDGILVSWNGQGNAPYAGNPVISGNAGVAGATLKYTGGSTTSDQDGNYAFTVPYGWSGTVTPSKTGYIFLPSKRTYTNLTTDKTTENYTAAAVYVISGNVGAAGVTLSYTDVIAKKVISQPNGNYSFIVPENWGGTVTPSHACYNFNPGSRTYTNLTADQPGQDYARSLVSGCVEVDVAIRGTTRGIYGVPKNVSLRASYVNVDNGPVEIASSSSAPLIGSERVFYNVNGVNASYSEMMALPDSQLDNTYWLPWYNSKDLDTQLRFANVSGSTATINVTIAGTPVAGSPFTLAAGASMRKSFPGIDKGPVRIQSNVNIIVSERVIYKVNNMATSFSELMALPNSQLDTTYWLPWYNSKDLDTQLRFANVSGSDATINVSIAGTPVAGSPFTLAAGASIRKSFPGIDKGPVKIESNVDIIASERVIYKVNNVATSFSELMALPNSQLDSTYWMPWYNNKDIDTQLRFANVSGSDATIHVTIGGVEVAGSPFTLAAGASVRKSFPGVDKGAVKVESNVDIIVSERVIYKVNNLATSFSEMMGLPNSLLDTVYWLPWYNNKDIDTQLRFGVP